MEVMVLNTKDVSYLEKDLLKDGQLIAVSFDKIKNTPQEDISLFCVKNAIYQIITTELVDFVRQEIGGEIAVEIGAGNGCLGRALGIKLTDNKMQQGNDLVNEFYDKLQQTRIEYPNDVIKMAGNEAVRHYRPKVVVASWVTQKWKPGMVHGSILGVNECAFKGKIKKYIHVGNERIHGDKEILKKFPVKQYKFPWLVSRSMHRDKNIIYVFDCK